MEHTLARTAEPLIAARATIDDEIRTVEQTLQELRARSAFLNKVIHYAKQEWPCHMEAIARKEQASLENLRHRSPELAGQIELLLGQAKEQARTVLKRFPTLLEKACAREGISIDATSSHPRYSFYKGFFQIEVSESRGTAVLRTRFGKLEEKPCDIEALIQSIKAEHTRIFARPFDGAKFLKKVYKYYSDIIKRDKKTAGDGIPVDHLIEYFKKKEKSFRLDEFIYDFSRMIRDSVVTVGGLTLDLQHTKDIDAGILLYEMENRGYIGYILFRRSTHA